MNFLVDTPYTPVWVRNEFLFNQERGHGEFTEGVVFGFRSEPARVPMFQVMLANGAQWARIPIHALCNKPCDPLPLNLSVWWDCYGYHCAVHQFAFLQRHRVSALGRDKVIRHGTYLFTVDWVRDGWSELPDQHKNHHIIVLDSGPWIAYPNNRLLWDDPSWIQHGPMEAWKSPEQSYSVEGSACDDF